MTRPMVIFGAAELAEQTDYYFTQYAGRRVEAFLVDAAYLKHDQLAGRPVVAWEEAQPRFTPATHDMFVAIGYTQLNQNRKRAFLRMQALGWELITFVHPRAYVAANVVLGPNTLVHEMASVAPMARLGDNVRVGAHASVSHHTVVGSHSFLVAGSVICGCCEIGECCFIGANATVRDRVRIDDNTLVGGGAVIMSSLRGGGVYPAAAVTRHPLRRSNPAP